MRCQPPLDDVLAHYLVGCRWWLLGLAVWLAVASLGPAWHVQYDRSIENMFASDDPLLVTYRRLKERFGGNEVVLAVYRDPDLLAEDGRGLRRLEEVTRRLHEVPGVDDAMSLSVVNQTLKGLAPLTRGDPILKPDSPLAEQYLRIFQRYTHDEAGQIAAIACLLRPEREAQRQSGVTRRDTIDRLRRVMQRLPAPLPPGMIAGEPVMVVDGFRFVEADGQRLGWWSTALLSLVVILSFRSLRWVLIPIAVVQLSMLLTQATLVWSGLELSMVSSMLTAIVTVVGVATVIHITVGFRAERQAGWPAEQAVLRVARRLAAPIFWACLTDAVGFAALLVAEVGPVRDFGLMMATGASFVLLSIGLLVPGMILLGGWDVDPRNVWGESRLESGLENLAALVSHRARGLGLAVAAAVLLTTLGVFRLQVETDFTRNFRAGSGIVRSYTFIENELGGAGVWDVILPAPEVLDRDYLDRVGRLEEALRQIEVPGRDGEPQRLTKVISLVDTLAAADADWLLARIPIPLRAARMRQTMPVFVDALWKSEPDSTGQCYLRIMLRARERQPAESKAALIRRVEAVVAEHFPAGPQVPGGEVTGFFVLLTNLIGSMIRDQWLCFAVATLGIGGMMWLAFRCPVLAAVALVPNALPILFVLGGMGWLGLRINMGAAMIAAVSMGLSVDSSIHYLTVYRRARLAGINTHQALTQAHASVGRAMVFSTLALIVGFTALTASQFVPTIYFGCLVGLSMLGGLAGNLVVLPLLLSLTSSWQACHGRSTDAP